MFLLFRPISSSSTKFEDLLKFHFFCVQGSYKTCLLSFSSTDFILCHCLPSFKLKRNHGILDLTMCILKRLTGLSPPCDTWKRFRLNFKNCSVIDWTQSPSPSPSSEDALSRPISPSNCSHWSKFYTFYLSWVYEGAFKLLQVLFVSLRKVLYQIKSTFRFSSEFFLSFKLTFFHRLWFCEC